VRGEEGWLAHKVMFTGVKDNIREVTHAVLFPDDVFL
jgi:hypothetical protein